MKLSVAGGAQFFAIGNVPWTEEEAISFLVRVDEIVLEERERLAAACAVVVDG